MNGIAAFIAWLGEAPPPVDRGSLTRSAMALWIVLTAGGVIFVAAVWAALSANRKRREAKAREQRRPGPPIKDAWDEAARRLEVEPPENPEDDDLRVDR
jgi:hypothetical protein